MAIKVGGDAAQIERHLLENVEGKAIPFTNEALAGMNDDARIKKIYRVDASRKGDVDASRREAEAFVLGSMALKGS